MNATLASVTIKKGDRVVLQREWTHPTRGLTFHRNTCGRVQDPLTITGGRVLVVMEFPHSPNICADLPIDLLKVG